MRDKNKKTQSNIKTINKTCDKLKKKESSFSEKMEQTCVLDENKKEIFMLIIWKLGYALYNLSKINLQGYPEGNVITKKSVQRRHLSGGHEREYVYYYDNVDVFGKGQYHLPVKNKGERKNPKDERWLIRDKIMYRRQIEQKSKMNIRLLTDAIKQYNSLKKCYEASKSVESVMKEVEIAIQNKEISEKQMKIDYIEGKLHYKNESQIVTILGEKVRSKNECIFANLLFDMQIPYLYESRVENQLLPDFTIFINDKIYYIELLGKMNEVKYRDRQYEKLAKYNQGGYILGEKLVYIDVTDGIELPRIKALLQGIIAGKIPESIFYGYNNGLSA